MTTKPDFSDIIHAIADGIPVQMQDKNDPKQIWFDFKIKQHPFPGIHNNINWRIKPKNTIRYLNVYPDDICDTGGKQLRGNTDMICTIRLEFGIDSSDKQYLVSQEEVPMLK